MSVVGKGTGILRYYGTGPPGTEGEWAGVALDEKVGDCDGGIGRWRAFDCKPGYGFFSPIFSRQVTVLGKTEGGKTCYSPLCRIIGNHICYSSNCRGWSAQERVTISPRPEPPRINTQSSLNQDSMGRVVTALPIHIQTRVLDRKPRTIAEDLWPIEVTGPGGQIKWQSARILAVPFYFTIQP